MSRNTSFNLCQGRDEMKQCRDVDNKITAMKTALEEIENLRQGASQEVSSLRARRFTLIGILTHVMHTIFKLSFCKRSFWRAFERGFL